MGDIRKTNCKIIGTNCEKSVYLTPIRQIIRGNQYKNINRLINGSQENKRILTIRDCLINKRIKNTSEKDWKKVWIWNAHSSSV